MGVIPKLTEFEEDGIREKTWLEEGILALETLSTFRGGGHPQATLQPPLLRPLLQSTNPFSSINVSRAIYYSHPSQLRRLLADGSGSTEEWGIIIFPSSHLLLHHPFPVLPPVL